MTTIEVIIAPTGEVTIEAVGFQGTTCEKATEVIEQALGVIASKTKKPEYYLQAKSANKQRT